MKPLNRIIVAEDDRATRQLLQHSLRASGYEVVPCGDGVEALEAIRASGGGIVVADWSMPNMDGLELCREVRRLFDRGEIGFVFVLLLTANDQPEDILAGFAAGADDYLTKPYNKQELLARLRAGERIYRLTSELSHTNRELTLLRDELQQLANTDPLTQVANRRRLYDRLEEEWSYTRRHGGGIGCVLFDIDRFKRVNDTYGHHAGDRVLYNVAQAALDTIRRHDLLGRFGGEEFLVIVRESNPRSLERLAERLRARIAGDPTRFEGHTIDTTISLGISLMRPHHSDPGQIIADADQALYLAKEHGRNQSWLFLPGNQSHRCSAGHALAAPADTPTG